MYTLFLNLLDLFQVLAKSMNARIYQMNDEAAIEFLEEKKVYIY